MLIYVLFVCVLLFIKCNNIGNRFMFGFVGIFVFVFVIGLVIGFVSIIGVEFISIVGVMLFLVVGNYIIMFIFFYVKIFKKNIWLIFCFIIIWGFNI